ncbi:MAG: DNA-processing protein DprA [Deltaproteobacteria bacterium]|nr:DNA-processing protein DprA [Deltaproteobacteria bacterium]
MNNSIQSLLALLVSYPNKRAQLTQQLLTTSDPTIVANQPEWRPKPEAWRLAAKQKIILNMFNIHCLTCTEFPPSLLRVRPLPPVLFIRGNVAALKKTAISIVGARNAQNGPREWAIEMARYAVAAGFVVASGGALGVDAAAHCGAIAARGLTVAYLGVAADQIYPASNRCLFERILTKNGALVSEHPPLTNTFASSHALRNRFIAGCAKHLLIAQAALQSGTLSTANFARRLNTQIWVPPAAIGGERSGINKLLEDGIAKELKSLEDVFSIATRE